MELAGKVAVVTGGASGIGKAMAARFRDDGMTVVIADVEQGALDATAAELGVVGVRTDVSDLASVEALGTEVIERFGTVHVLCNNAGVGGGGRLDSQTMRDWEWVVGVNLWGVVHGLQVFLPHLEGNADGGHVVNTASMAGLAPFPGIGVYNATKYAVVGISETLAIELAGSGVGVSVLCPGVVNTNIFRSQRNRPEHLRNPQRNAAARAANEELVGQEGIDPSVVADKVANAIREGEFWIITHPDLLTHVDARHRALMRHALDH
jgi:NAD(P)-dependent dehydrogenase (short-subunit alcohol dehydrogenase family)